MSKTKAKAIANGERTHRRAWQAAEAAVAPLSLTAEERAVAVGMAYDRFKSVSLELARGGASRDTVAAVFLAGQRYAEAFFGEEDTDVRGRAPTGARPAASRESHEDNHRKDQHVQRDR